MSGRPTVGRTGAEHAADQALAMEERRWEALIARDVDTLTEFFDPELVYTHSNGMVDTAESYLGALAAGAFTYVGVERTDTRATVHGSTAFITGAARIRARAGDDVLQIDSRYTSVWNDSDGAWRFVCWHSSPDTTG